MTPARAAVAALLGVGLACKPAPPAADASPPLPAAQEPPVPLDAESPIQYPPKLFDQHVEGDVVLRLVVDSTGRLLPESTRVAESSGYRALDSAAVAGARNLHFAPARRRGVAVSTAFLEPIEFRHPQDTTPHPRAPDAAPH